MMRRRGEDVVELLVDSEVRFERSADAFGAAARERGEVQRDGIFGHAPSY